MTLQKEKSEKSTNPHDSPSLEFQKELAKKVAILFTDVKGSSAFYKTHGNLAGRIMIQKLNDMLFPIVTAYKGIIVKTIGDSIMACFPSPKEALQKYLHSSSGGEDLPHILKIGLHSTDGSVMGNGKSLEFFSISDIHKRHIYLLIARLYEVSGSLPHAEKEI